MRITDTYDALASNRGYRAAYSSMKAWAIMEQEHHFFDPQLLEIFFKMQGAKNIKWKSESPLTKKVR
jgi:HD-GYP domain-containing protein (c-di-GMP phosphodiesterase class II)